MRLVVSSADGLSHPLRLVASSGRRLVCPFAVSSGRRQTVGRHLAVSSEGTPFTVYKGDKEDTLRLVIEPCVSAIAFPTPNHNILWEGGLRLVIGENAIFCTLFQML